MAHTNSFVGVLSENDSDGLRARKPRPCETGISWHTHPAGGGIGGVKPYKISKLGVNNHVLQKTLPFYRNNYDLREYIMLVR
ncbi:hypothetical protein ACFL6G_07865 [candidate division KSB1 bacterium]